MERDCSKGQGQRDQGHTQVPPSLPLFSTIATFWPYILLALLPNPNPPEPPPITITSYCVSFGCTGGIFEKYLLNPPRRLAVIPTIVLSRELIVASNSDYSVDGMDFLIGKVLRRKR